ncbi:hypothetical protein [Paremcibacter congregatus]|uniref:hypothetical protein n=1 Tax=Paremcibacter congregatus TaxID=2043170 RepID=UPI0030EF8740|tara:strand:- start:2556 stop:2801 length:246 start_codon:yes stop_codon:yes gene_type:complete
MTKIIKEVDFRPLWGTVDRLNYKCISIGGFLNEGPRQQKYMEGDKINWEKFAKAMMGELSLFTGDISSSEIRRLKDFTDDD